MSSKTSEARRFYSVFAVQAFIATLQEAQKSYRTLKVLRPKPGGPLYVVVVYG